MPTTAVVTAEKALQSCIAQLPGHLRIAFRQRDRRIKARWTGREREQWRVCALRERDRDDAKSIAALSDHLVAMAGTVDAATEARAIAAALVTTTRAEAEKYRMVGSPLFNNFLIQIGAKNEGYCYHWTEALLQALPPEHGYYFERHWGGANVGRATENNAVIVTAKGAPLDRGLVYDAWRGAGRPWWMWVKEDHYRWVERSESISPKSAHGELVEP